MVNQDRQQLQLLSTLHYVFGGITMAIGSFPLIHLILGIALVTGTIPIDSADDPFPKEFFGWMFVVIPSILILMSWSVAILSIISGKKLARRKNYSYCFFVACVECLFMPFGTALGVFTIIVLSRESVKALFSPSPA